MLSLRSLFVLGSVTLAFSVFTPSVVLTAEPAPAAETLLAVAPASSELAVATGTAERYRIALPGEPAGPARWRTSSAGRGEFIGTAGRLRLGSEGELKFSEASQKVELTEGRLFVTASHPWTVDVAGFSVEIPEGGQAEVQLAARRPLVLTVLQGSAIVRGKDLVQKEVAAGNRATLADDAREFVQVPLSDEDQEKLVARWETPAVESGVGQLQIQDPRTQSPSRLQLARYHVNVVLSPPVALVQIDQSFYNPHQRTLEGTFTFNLPAGASVSRFAMYTSPTELVEGELIGRERANEVYDRIVRRKLDPAILEQVGRNTFKMRVFPIPGRDVKRILLDYTLPLADRGNGDHRFELPLAADIAPIRDFRITGRILGATTPKSLTFPASPRTTILPVAEDPLRRTDLRFELVERGFVPAAPFVVQFRQPAGQGPTYREQQVTAGPAQKPENIFLATIPPSALTVADADVLPTATNPFAETDARPVDLLILAQTSIDTPQRGRLRSAVRTLVRSLGTADRWQLGCADADFRPLTQRWLAPQGEDARSALASFDREFFLGAFDPGQVLQSALDHLGPVDPQRRRLVVLISDASMPKERPLQGADREAIVGKFREAAATLNLVELGDGNSWRLEFQTLAHQTGGRVFSAGTETRWHDLFAWSLDHFPLGVRIASVQADGVPADDLFAPSLWSPTEPLMILGRRPTTGDFSLTVRLEWRGRTFDRELTIVKQSDDDRFVGRLWGQRKLDQMQDKLLAMPESPLRTQFQKSIVELSQEWTLLSPQTAFLVLETEKDYERWNIVRGRRRPFWEPEGATTDKPLSLAELARLRRDYSAEPSQNADRVQEFLRLARQAIEKEDWMASRYHLDVLKGDLRAGDSAAYRKLEQQAANGVQRIEDRRNLGDLRTLFEQSVEANGTADIRVRLRDGLQSLVSQRMEESREPGVLDKIVSPPQKIVDLREFADWLREEAGLNVVIDEKTIDESSLGAEKFLLSGIRAISLESLLDHKFRSNGFGYLFDEARKRLLITSDGFANDESQLFARTYNVEALLTTRVALPQSALVNPRLDRQLTSDVRLREKLNRQVSVNFEETPLPVALSFLAQKMDDNIILGWKNDVDASEPPNVTLQVEDEPVAQVLTRLLPGDWQTTIVREAVVLTQTPDENAYHSTRFYPAQGVVFDLDALKFPGRRAPLPPYWYGGIGGGGVGGGGPGFGGGGFGGGLGGGAGGFGGGRGFGGGGAFGRGGADAGNAAGAEAKRKPAEVVSGAGLSFSNEQNDEAEYGTDRDEIPPAFRPLAAGESKRFDSNPWNQEWRPDFASEMAAAHNPNSKSNWAEVMDVIESTVDPSRWESLGGTGAIRYCDNAMGFVVWAPDSMHQKIEALFSQLRQTRPTTIQRAGYIPARLSPALNSPQGYDFNSLIDSIQSGVRPADWEVLGGIGSIRSIESLGMLVVRHSDHNHRDLRELLTLLHRGQFQARYGRPWSLGASADPRAILNLDDLSGIHLRANLPTSKIGELAALQGRRDPVGEAVWRVRSAGPQGLTRVSFRTNEERQEFSDGSRIARLQDDQAVVAYPGVGLARTGPWAEDLRRQFDSLLPWLPHRSNDELARMFEVTETRRDEATFQVRLHHPATGEGTDLVVTFDRRTQLPVKWESWIAGQLVQRLEFADLVVVDKIPIWKTVTARDAQGGWLATWELDDSRGTAREIPTLAASWPDLLRFDPAHPETTLSAPLMRALTRMAEGAWEPAKREFASLPEVEARLPLVSLLKAFTEYSAGEREPAKRVAALVPVVKSNADELRRLIAEGLFELLPRELYELLRQQPADQRSRGDLLALAQAAANAGRLEGANAALDAALKAGSVADAPNEENRALLELLLKLQRTDAAVELADGIAHSNGWRGEELMSLSELLHQFHQEPSAKKLAERAFDNPKLTTDRRARLLARRAMQLPAAEARQFLVEAAVAAPRDTPLRRQIVAELLSRLTGEALELEAAEQWAKTVEDTDVAASLWYRIADLRSRLDQHESAAEAAWKGYTLRPDHEYPLDRLCQLQNKAGQHERVIQIVETELRAGEPVTREMVDFLDEAYTAVGRELDAIRAATNILSLPTVNPANRPASSAPGGFFRGI